MSDSYVNPQPEIFSFCLDLKKTLNEYNIYQIKIRHPPTSSHCLAGPYCQTLHRFSPLSDKLFSPDNKRKSCVSIVLQFMELKLRPTLQTTQPKYFSCSLIPH